MSISGITSASSNSYIPAGDSGKDTSKLENQIKELRQKIKDVDNSFDSPKAKKLKKQQLEVQISSKEAELKQAQKGASSNNIASNNAAGKANENNEQQGTSSEEKNPDSIIDVRV